MAIVEMKRIDLLAMRQDQKKLLRAMQRMGCVEVTPISGENLEAYQKQDVTRLPQVETTMERLRWTIGQLSQYNRQKPPFLGSLPDADAGDVQYIQQHEAELMALLDQAEELEKTGGDLRGQLARIQVAQEQLEPWKGLDIPVENIVSTRSVFQQVGTISKGLAEELMAKYATQPVYIQVLGEVRDSAYIWVVAHASLAGELGEALKAASFTPAQFGDMHGTVAQRLEAYRQEREEINGRAQAVTQEWQEMANANLTRLKTWYDLLQIEKDQQEAAKRTIGTGQAFLLRGWVPAALGDKVSAELQKLSPTCSVEIYAPAEDDEPPILLHNGKFATPFESVVEGFALPSPKGMDPTAVMAPFYALIFGMMLSDAGYGLVMALAIPLLLKLKKPGKNSVKMLWLLF